MGYPKIELPRNGQYIHLNEPKIFHDEITQTYKCANKISVQINQMAETHIVQAIIEYAKERGINDLFLIDEDFVKSALLNEKRRREKQELKPKTNFDRITENEGVLAEFILTVSNCEMNDCHDCPLFKTYCNSKDGIKEWLQKECEG